MSFRDCQTLLSSLHSRREPLHPRGQPSTSRFPPRWSERNGMESRIRRVTADLARDRIEVGPTIATSDAGSLLSGGFASYIEGGNPSRGFMEVTPCSGI